MQIGTHSGQNVKTHAGSYIEVSLDHSAAAAPIDGAGWTDLADRHPGNFAAAGYVGGFLGQSPTPLASTPNTGPFSAGILDCAHVCAYRSVGRTDNVEVGVLWNIQDIQAYINQVGPVAFAAPDDAMNLSAVITTVAMGTDATSGEPIVTLTTSTAHGFSVGKMVLITGFTDGQQTFLNETRQVYEVPSANTFVVLLNGIAQQPATTPTPPPTAIQGTAVPVSYSIASGFVTITTSNPHGFTSGGAVTLSGFTGSQSFLNGTQPVLGAYGTSLVFATSSAPGAGSIPAGASAVEIPRAEQHNGMGISNVFDVSVAAWYPLEVFNSPAVDVLEPSRYPILKVAGAADPVPSLGQHWVTMRCVAGQVAGYFDGELLWGPIATPSWATGRDAWGFHAVQLQYQIGSPCFDAGLEAFSNSPAMFTTTTPHPYVAGDQIQITDTASPPDPNHLDSGTASFPGYYQVTSVPSATTFVVQSAPAGALAGTLPTRSSAFGPLPVYQAAWIADHQSPVQILDWYARPYSGSF